MEIIYGSAAAFVVTAFGILGLLPKSSQLGLVDHPGGHRLHGAATPIVGGLAMFLGLLAGLGVLPEVGDSGQGFLLGAVLLVTAGYLDDRRLIGTVTKALLQIGAACALVVLGNVVIHDMGNLLGVGSIQLGWMAVPFTVFAIVGLINAMNMLDGMDGLAGGTALTITSVLAFAAFLAGAYSLLAYILVAISVIVAFLCFNARLGGRQQARVFMGDTGSMLLGFILAWFVIALSQEPLSGIRPMTALWILIVPVMDTFRLMLLRSRERVSPFAADNRHLHHLLARAGLSVNQIVLLASLATLLFSGVAFYIQALPSADMLLFYVFASLFFVYLALAAGLANRTGTLENSGFDHTQQDRQST